ncbi:hypothetical protein [Lactococcus garvieae]
MAKYGINQFINGELREFTVDPVSLLGPTYFGGVEVQERFDYVDVETGEKFEEQNAGETLKPVNTHEIEDKWIMVVTDNFSQSVEVKVPLDFDESKFAHLEEIHLTGKVTSSPFSSMFETVLPNGNTRRVPKITFTLKAESVKAGAPKSTGKQGNKPQEGQAKPENK